MDSPKILSGDEMVARGVTKLDGTLPEAGLKDVVPNGSWLEQKQIQSALEARKHLIEVERIEKCGVLSHADWREDLMLAEVSQQAGGHWQFFGHSAGKQLFLKPEEALFLMETNCLQLKYNDVTVSLQQAYSLLLRSKVTILQYKVYASLSRIGYKVYRYRDIEPIDNNKNDLSSCSKNLEDKDVDVADDTNDGNQTEEIIKMEVGNVQEVDNTEICDITNNMEFSKEDNNSIQDVKKEPDLNKEEIITDSINSTENHTPANNSSTESINSNELGAKSHDTDTVEVVLTENIEMKESMEDLVSDVMSIESDSAELSKDIANHRILGNNHKLNRLENRHLKPIDSKHIETSFEKMPELTQEHIVTVTVPEEQYIPRNVFLNNLNYVLNLESIRAKTRDARLESTESRPYSLSEEVNGEHVRRIRDSVPRNLPTPNWTPPRPNIRFNNPNFQFQTQFWRPNFPGIPFNIFLQNQRPFLLNMNMNFMPRFRQFFRPPLPPRFPIPPEIQNVSRGNRRKRNKARDDHLAAIVNLASRLKQLIQLGAHQDQNIRSLTNLINTFNERYRATVHLTETFDIEEENIVETISLDDDEETPRKKLKKDNDNYNENLNKLKQVALKLQHLDSRDEVSSRHRRAFSNLLKKFNRSYNADIHMNSNYEIIDKRFVNLDSSSDSDCVVQEAPKSSSSKKLKNPFNIIKRLSEKQNVAANIQSTNTVSSKYEELKELFGRNWLPPEDDFGRAEIARQNLENDLLDSKCDEYLYEFIKSQPYEFSNWLELKIAFLKSYEESNAMMENHSQNTGSIPEINSIVRPEDCTDTESVLKKLRIIKTNEEIDPDTSLAVDFDVYNRDVQNFRKSKPPTPHFRVICVSESSSFPSGKDVASLHAKYPDNVPIVFAVVGVGSISYLQMNPTNLPVYIPNNDFA